MTETAQKASTSQWLIAIGSITALLLVSVAIAYAGGDQGVRLGSLSVFAWCGVFAYGVQWIVFIHAWQTLSEKFFDLTGSLTYVVMAVAAVIMSAAYDLRAITLLVLISIWALRLGPFLYFRIKQAGEDKRFRSIRIYFPTFFMTWTIQGTWVYLTSCAALAAITSGRVVPVDAFFLGGLALWMLGFGIEVIADRQKTAFRANPENANRFITTGLWAWSRHPNYFGEIMLWAGIAVMAIPVLEGWQLFTLISPIWVLFLLTAISGVRMLENRAARQWGEDPEYQSYKARTPVLVMLPPKQGG